MDNAEQGSERAGQQPQARADDRADSTRKNTPNTDMQAEDVTTGDSVKPEAAREDSPRPDTRSSAGGTPAQEAMKQTSKTDAEAGG